VALPVGLDQVQLGHPVELAHEGHGVALQAGEDPLPALDHEVTNGLVAETARPCSFA